MNCAESADLIVAQLEGELDPARAAQLDSHVRDCANCQRTVEEQRTLGEALKADTMRFAAPDALRWRIAATLQAEDAAADGAPAAPRPVGTARWSAPWRPLAMAASLALAIVTSSGVTAYFTLPDRQDNLVQDVVNQHIRSLMAEHLTDVASSDQHTVKPWFHGKLDISPPVDDLKADGFPLIGGRLDYLDQRAVAALVYRHRQHPINVFILPAGESAASTTAGAASFVQRGFNVLHWTQNGMSLWAVSDLNLAELKDFEKLFESRTAESGGS